jgi:hypothetical protein
MVNAMTHFSSVPAVFVLGLGLVAGLPMTRAAADPLTIFESATPFESNGLKPLRLGSAALGSAVSYTYKNDSVSFSDITGNDGVVRGSSPGVYSAPIIDAAGDPFRGKYLSTGNTGYINIAFATPQQSLSFLWGSVDAGNEITFLNGNQVVAVVDGTDIDTASGDFPALDGSAYVLIDSSVKFDDVEVSSLQPSFELAQIRSDSAEVPVHEPASVALFGGFLLGFVSMRQGKRFFEKA